MQRSLKWVGRGETSCTYENVSLTHPRGTICHQRFESGPVLSSRDRSPNWQVHQYGQSRASPLRGAGAHYSASECAQVFSHIRRMFSAEQIRGIFKRFRRLEISTETIYLWLRRDKAIGNNENFNGLLRQYVPTGACLQHRTQKQCDYFAEELHDRPLTPSKVFLGRTSAALAG